MFCPADRPERFAKALERADAVILDLEDGVAPADRTAARGAIVAFGAAVSPEATARTVVRVNAAGTSDFAVDVAVVRASPFRTVMLPKAESAAELDELAAAVPGVRVIALCESAKGVLAAPELARHAAVDALMWGAEDLLVSLGGASSRRADGTYRDVATHARSAVLLAAAAGGCDAIDAVHVDLDDLTGLAAEAEDAVACGFAATCCLHPRQVSVVREAYRPSESQVEAARNIVTAAHAAPGAFRLGGRMIDEPLIAQARAVLRRAGGL
ncbi:HpcH/HpaI aldolase/citrate lyase family protein [Humibacter ginsenosidimutans]|uniref:CoA ester lyase n=1 Tax=Humibacter ginsenosidimutans TaxID=2599293 RepID=A0A5B8M789_9MICO|nr:CoA ester lyase [Humibacter ginsenosidimutans]QDZ16588.1 CoA ester lyase [Humibacter ginsenosidimutans]